MEKEGGDPTINIMWKLERERGWRINNDDEDDDGATMMFPEDVLFSWLTYFST